MLSDASDSHSLASECSNGQQSTVWRGREVERWTLLTIYQPQSYSATCLNAANIGFSMVTRKWQSVGRMQSTHTHTHTHNYTRTGLKNIGYKHLKDRLISSANIFICISSPFPAEKKYYGKGGNIFPVQAQEEKQFPALFTSDRKWAVSSPIIDYFEFLLGV